jgi:putative NADH-flavin reductase
MSIITISALPPLLVMGANGGIGRQAVEVGLGAGHRVIAVVRNPAKLSLTHPNLTVVKGDVLQPATFERYLVRGMVVISAIGVSGGLSGDKPTTLYSEGSDGLLRAMERAGVRRVFFISASAVEISPELPLLVRFAAKYILQRLLRYMYADLRVMESRVKESDADWTIVRPPRLTDKRVTGRYRFAVNRFLKNSLSISRGDVAHFMINNALNEDTYKGVVEVGY